MTHFPRHSRRVALDRDHAPPAPTGEQLDEAKDKAAALSATLALAELTVSEAVEALAAVEEYVGSVDFAILDEADRADIRRMLPHMRSLVGQMNAVDKQSN
jgi:hypothetical protein